LVRTGGACEESWARHSGSADLQPKVDRVKMDVILARYGMGAASISACVVWAENDRVIVNLDGPEYEEDSPLAPPESRFLESCLCICRRAGCVSC